MRDTAAFTELYEAQHPRVVAYARRRLGALDEAEDCAAEVFRLAWEHDSTPSVGWLFVTARNIVYALHRSSLRLSELAARVAREESTRVADDEIGLLDALDELSENDRELLMAFYWDDLTGAQCAQLLGCSTPAVWVRLHRARRALKDVLLKEGTTGDGSFWSHARASTRSVVTPVRLSSEPWQGETS